MSKYHLVAPDIYRGNVCPYTYLGSFNNIKQAIVCSQIDHGFSNIDVIVEDEDGMRDIGNIYEARFIPALDLWLAGDEVIS